MSVEPEIVKSIVEDDAFKANIDEAIFAIREAVADFAKAAAEGRAGAADAAARAVTGFETLADEMRDYAIKSVSRSVREKPLTALAAAAGAGYLFALWSRGRR